MRQHKRQNSGIMKLNILLCDRFPGLLPEYIPSYESMFVKLFRGCCDELEYKVYAVMDGIMPPAADDGAVNLITGCNMSAYDDVPWIDRLREWVREAHCQRLPMVGICFGHQLIAQALGGKVERSSRGWGTGIREARLVGEEARRHFPRQRMRLMYNHHDQVVELPEGATLFATSPFCPIEGYTIGHHIITFQGHPEYDPQYAVHLLMDFADAEPIEVRRAALRSIGNYAHDGALVARWIAERQWR